MLIPIPGLAHLKYLEPDQPAIQSNQRKSVPRDVISLVQISLDAFYGLRPITHLDPKRFDVAVRAHVNARRKSRKAGAFKLLSCHVQLLNNSAEVHGRIHCIGQITAFAARLSMTDGKWRMHNFRVLS